MTRRELTADELARETGEPLPDREAMSTIDLGDAAMTALPLPVDDAPVDDDDQVFQADPNRHWRPPAF